MNISDIRQRFSQRIKTSEAIIPDTNEKPANEEATENVKIFISEEDVGITEYIADLPGFRGIIKQRYSDFNVHEIDRDGQKVVLNNSTIPKNNFEFDDDLDEKHVTEVHKVLNGEVDKYKVDVSNWSKEERGKLHSGIKGKFGETVVSNTVDENDCKYIIISKKKGEDRWRGPQYLYFVLNKWNMDTSQALRIIGGKLKLKASNFGIAGTKDKRASTSQWVSVRFVKAEKLKRLALRQMCTGNYKYEEHPLKLGNLMGNNFQIALRNIEDNVTIVEQSLESLQNKGFANYFGMQRFGATGDTHIIGKTLILEHYTEAIDLILRPRDLQEPLDLKKARNIWMRTKDATQAVNALKAPQRTLEGQLLLGLAKHGRHAPLNALDSLSRNLKLMYLHAYQSLLWNRVLSKRLVKYGLKLLPGDLVLCDGENDTEEKVPKVRTLIEDEISDVTIYDIVHPIPGHDIIYPKNEIAQWFEECLAEDGLTSEKLLSRVKDFSLPGAYRAIVKKPKNLTWRFVRYNASTEDLILSDFDLMQGKTVQEYPDGRFLAVILNMDLDSSTYATMALREILRQDTSSNYQTTLNAYEDCNKKRSHDEEEEEEDDEGSRKRR